MARTTRTQSGTRGRGAGIAGAPRNAAMALARRPWLLVMAVGLVLFANWAIGTRATRHHVRAVFAEAVNLFPGEDVQVGGLNVGKITTVDKVDGRAVVGLGINDPTFWPIHQGTTATLRYGTTIGNGTRYVSLTPGPISAPAIPENGIIGIDHTVGAVEFDEVFNTFDGRTRRAVQDALQNTGTVVGPRPAQIGAGVQTTAPALSAISGLAADLVRNEVALSGFVANGNDVTSRLADHDTQLTGLVSGASTTFHAFASNTPGITGSLDRMPQTLVQVRSTLARLDESVGHLHNLITDLRPGAAQLDGLSRDLRPAFAELRATIPTAVQTLQVGTRTAPQVTRLLKDAQPFSDKAAPALSGLAPMVGCITPYSPEIASFFTQWASFTAGYDGNGHLGRLWANAGPTSLTATPATPGQFTQMTGQGYALLRPPGYNAGQPLYLPQCGITAAGLDPTKDPEAQK